MHRILFLFVFISLHSYAQRDSLRNYIQQFFPLVDLHSSMHENWVRMMNDTTDLRIIDTSRCSFCAEYKIAGPIPGAFSPHIYYETEDDSDWVCHAVSYMVSGNFGSYNDAARCRDSLLILMKRIAPFYKLKPDKSPILGNIETVVFTDKDGTMIATLDLYSPFDLFPFWRVGIVWIAGEK